MLFMVKIVKISKEVCFIKIFWKIFGNKNDKFGSVFLF